MTPEELQAICDKIQTGWRTADCFPTMNRYDNKKRFYYCECSIFGTLYNLNLSKKIIIEDVEL